MPYYRITYEGYLEGDYESREVAVQEMLDIMRDGDGMREPSDLLDVQTFDEEKQEWVSA